MKNLIALATLGTTALILTACATPAPPPPPAPEPVVYTPPPEPVVYTPPPAPVVTVYTPPQRSIDERLTEVLVRDASYHGSTMQNVSRASYNPIQTREDLDGHLDNLAGVFTPRLGAGLLSYGGLIAAQNPSFADSVIERATNEGADTVVYKLYSDPNYALTFNGSYDAASDVMAAWQDDKSAFDSAAAAVKAQSYELQKDPNWKKMRSGDRKDRIAKFKAAQTYAVSLPDTSQRAIAAAGSVTSSDFDGAARSAAFWQAYGKTSKPVSYSSGAQISPNATRSLTLGALEVLGSSGKNSSTWIANYTTDINLNQCLNWARLHTEQCLAAGHYKFEDAFCVAEHELKDISECLTKSGY